MSIDILLASAATLSAFMHLWFVWFHATCPRRFRWDIDLRHVSEFGRSLITTLNICLMYLFAALALGFGAIAAGAFGGAVAGGFCVLVAGLWLLRASLQRTLIPASGAADWRWLGLFGAMAALSLVVGAGAW